MRLDIYTMLVMVIVSSLAMAGAMAVVGARGRRDGMGYWASALLLNALAYTLFLLRGQAPELLTIVLANTVASGVLSGLMAALSRFLGRALPWWQMLTPPVLTFFLLLLFTFDYGARVVLVSTLLSAQTGGLLLVMFQHRHTTLGRGRVLVVAGFTVELLILLLRLGYAASNGMDRMELAHGTPVQSLTFMTTFILVLVASLGFVFMAKDRADEHNRELAAQDALTGVANRRSIIAALERDAARALRTREPLALMMIDIDHFKQVNDRHGHLAGDQVLRTVVDRVGQRLRAQDILGRYGGEEFLVVLPDTTLQGAQQLAQQLCEAVQAQPVDCGGQRLAVAVSIGVFGGRLEPGDSWDLLIHAADSALYRAKEAGRNRVEVADGVERVPPTGAAAPADAGPTTYPSFL